MILRATLAVVSCKTTLWHHSDIWMSFKRTTLERPATGRQDYRKSLSLRSVSAALHIFVASWCLWCESYDFRPLKWLHLRSCKYQQSLTLYARGMTMREIHRLSRGLGLIRLRILLRNLRVLCAQFGLALQEVLQVISPSQRTNYVVVVWKIQLFRADY